MSKKPEKAGKNWTDSDVEELRQLAKSNTPTGLIAYELGRSIEAIRSKASDLRISLKPVNKSPYDRKFSNERKG